MIQLLRRGAAGSSVGTILLMGLLCSSSALTAEFDDEYDQKPWSEIEVQLPPFPEPGNMIPFGVGAVSDTTFLIDSESLSYGTDRVIRYTLEVVSPSGAKNISYEGMRCETGERRFYAFGRADNTWSKARSNKWVKISGTSNNHHVELFSNYFCTPGSTAVESAEEARQVLRSGGQRAKRN
ncbi:MAG: CNP1-like family protein [Propionivibrio sp.]